MDEEDRCVNDVAVKVTGRILCDGAFVFVDPLDPSMRPAIAEWDARGVGLTFSGHDQGALSVWAGDSFMVQVAANMLGIDEKSKRAYDEGCDAVGEILNMIAGNLLTAMYGTEPVFDLGLPRRLAKEQLSDEIEQRDCVWFEAEGEPVLFTFMLSKTENA
ncbi:MAG: hypothetical protein GF344_18640 [Chitinivibrionales bacterium]|nr:hypothetical protein [Chitinivibrionales bacterium]MBD3358667.1 hypothetical protein [Chitinivibrionales bacterium]